MNAHRQPSPEQPAQNPLADGFARHVVHWAQAAGAPADSLAVLAAAARHASLAVQGGHVCAQLDDLAAGWPDCPPGELAACLLASRMVASVGDAQPLPLLLDADGRIYLYRHFAWERRLAARLRQLAGQPAPAASAERSRQLDQLFADNARRLGGAADWQKLAAALALRGRLTIISGGPGTGKTTTVVALLACLLQESPDLRVALAAPTGKAAARMLEALRKRASDLPRDLQGLLPNESYTVHRLLGVTPQAGRFRHHAQNPLAIDALIVDEASMLDLALACRLFDAVPPDARVVLLGDKDQLAAVEAGAVFAEISADPTLSAGCIEQLAALASTPVSRITPPAASVPTPLTDCVVWFSESHRFAATSGIGRLAAAINAGRSQAASQWLASDEDRSVRWLADGSDRLAERIRQTIVDGYQPFLDALAARHADPATHCAAVFAAFDRFRVLCALHDGARGVQAINRMVAEHLLSAVGEPIGAASGQRSPWYPGRPVIVLRNDYLLRLFNGDIGVCLADESGEPMVWFPAQDGSFRPVAPIRLPAHDTAFAMTVHKSQGSEFAAVLLLLPETDSRVLTRELLYTGVTRAAAQLTLVGSAEVLNSACANPTRRHSGLIARLRDAEG
ncbi:MAG: exodeoxyribonuclease V subunit alpha [Candidatus Accumulibacter sp.]|uniref:exodeoxyribonuclease V subunit alpha n=1 Tax=Accumulibacter sp. TaxID=2053492 RepID=UPI0025E28804|nr:exodeoxyribonuclease V subunit alpha [Accumulibacter sp.]MCP5249830.1 exodeoxyribonuclease V subunit alpha [Accumulibacter sp.]